MRFRYVASKIFIFCGVVILCGSAYAAENDLRQTPVVKVVRDTADAVVNISTEKIILLRQNPFWGGYGNDFDAFYNQFSAFHGMASALKLKSVGSGVIVEKGGLIATNAHVVNMASSVFVIFNDGKQVPGQVVYENREDDLAFIKIDPPKPLLEAVLGQTADLMLGETVVAIGNPLGLENTVTSGIVSGKNRQFYSAQGNFMMGNMIQIDAPINPGNSGGALFNLNGKLIGINVAVVEYSQNIGFAVPVEKLKQALAEYKQKGPIPPTLKNTEARNSPDNQDNARQAMVFDDANLNLEELANEYLLKFDISGLDKNKVKVEINNNFIRLTDQYSSSLTQKSSANSSSAQAFGSFIKMIPLPSDADSRSVNTEAKDDMLLIHIPKKNSQLPATK